MLAWLGCEAVDPDFWIIAQVHCRGKKCGRHDADAMTSYQSSYKISPETLFLMPSLLDLIVCGPPFAVSAFTFH
jgi:hypothetical protein